jgi:hypothetical protein
MVALSQHHVTATKVQAIVKSLMVLRWSTVFGYGLNDLLSF